MKIIILCGGSGSRLWPLSRKNYPKQFLKLYGELSLLQTTYARARKLVERDDIYFVTNFKNYYSVFNQIKEIEPAVSKEQILTEPAKRNTAPAILFAASFLQSHQIDPNEPLVVMPSDHFIQNEEAFVKTVRKAAEIATKSGSIVTIGITPDSAQTGYGYIQKGAGVEQDVFEVNQFKEKPNLQTAQEYIASENYFWNSGMFVFTLASLVRELTLHNKVLYDHFALDHDTFVKRFDQLEEDAFDTAVAERTKDMKVIEGDFGWSDVGSFDAVVAMGQDDRTHHAKHTGVDSRNVHVFGTKTRLIATVGVSDLIVVENNDSVLICKTGQSEDVKQLMSQLEKEGHEEVESNIIEHRPWGSFEVLIDTPTYKVKKIVVYPGETLSLQSHKHRSEHWVVVTGQATAVNGDTMVTLDANESVFIPKAAKHQLSNRSNTNLEIIEVQTGTYLGEDDIVRYEDVYNRV